MRLVANGKTHLGDGQATWGNSMNGRAQRTDIFSNATNSVQWWSDLPGPTVGPKKRFDFGAVTSAWDIIDGQGRFLLQRDGTILVAGQTARSLVDQMDCLAIRDRTKLIGCGPSACTFAQLLHVPSHQTQTVILPDQRSGGHAIVTSVGVCRNSVGVAVRLASDSYKAKYADFAKAFALTPCEVHVIEMQMCGATPQEVSRELGVSIHTVRTHIRHCYDKLGVSNREELWQKLSPFRIN